MREYVIYKGEEIICSGTLEECAKKLNIKPSTIQFYTTPSYLKRLERRKKSLNARVVVKV